MSGILYLAAPYTHPDPAVRNDRVEVVSMVAADLMTQGYTVFSPITHGHRIADVLPQELSHSHEFWMKQCLPVLNACSMLCVVPLAGWEESKGLQRELAHWASQAKPLHFYQCADETPPDHPIQRIPDNHHFASYFSILKGFV